MREMLRLSAFVSTVATSSGDDPGAWTWNKVKGASVGIVSLSAVDSSVGLLKDAIRPHAPPRG